MSRAWLAVHKSTREVSSAPEPGRSGDSDAQTVPARSRLKQADVRPVGDTETGGRQTNRDGLAGGWRLPQPFSQLLVELAGWEQLEAADCRIFLELKGPPSLWSS